MSWHFLFIGRLFYFWISGLFVILQFARWIPPFFFFIFVCLLLLIISSDAGRGHWSIYTEVHIFSPKCHRVITIPFLTLFDVVWGFTLMETDTLSKINVWTYSTWDGDGECFSLVWVSNHVKYSTIRKAYQGFVTNGIRIMLLLCADYTSPRMISSCPCTFSSCHWIGWASEWQM